MAENSTIEWTTHTFSPWWGCVQISPACEHCYAMLLALWRGYKVWGKDAPRRFLTNDTWRRPLAWNRGARNAGERHYVFCASMCDVFERRAELDEERARLWTLMADTSHLDWQLLDQASRKRTEDDSQTMAHELASERLDRGDHRESALREQAAQALASYPGPGTLCLV